MAQLLRVLRLGTMIGLGAIGLGFLVLLASAFSEVLADPSLSLEDGYWIGRLPWTAVGVGLVVAGSSLALVAGALAALVAGGALRRVVAALLLLVGVAWWLLAILETGLGAGCPGCTAPPFDPITAAYSLPQQALLLLVLPALLAAVLALTIRRAGAERARPVLAAPA